MVKEKLKTALYRREFQQKKKDKGNKNEHQKRKSKAFIEARHFFHLKTTLFAFTPILEVLFNF